MLRPRSWQRRSIIVWFRVQGFGFQIGRHCSKRIRLRVSSFVVIQISFFHFFSVLLGFCGIHKPLSLEAFRKNMVGVSFFFFFFFFFFFSMSLHVRMATGVVKIFGSDGLCPSLSK